VIRKDTGWADTQGGGQEDGQKDEADEADEDNVAKYTTFDD